VPAVSRISSIHCCPSTSTCCKRKKATDESIPALHTIKWTQMRSKQETMIHVKTKDKKETRQKNRDEGISKREKKQEHHYMTWTYKAAANNQFIPIHHSTSPLKGHSPFCTSLLLSGHIFPQRFPVQTEPSVREETKQADVRWTWPPGNKNKTSRAAKSAMCPRRVIATTRQGTEDEDVHAVTNQTSRDAGKSLIYPVYTCDVPIKEVWSALH